MRACRSFTARSGSAACGSVAGHSATTAGNSARARPDDPHRAVRAMPPVAVHWTRDCVQAPFGRGIIHAARLDRLEPRLNRSAAAGSGLEHSEKLSTRWAAAHNPTVDLRNSAERSGKSLRLCGQVLRSDPMHDANGQVPPAWFVVDCSNVSAMLVGLLNCNWLICTPTK